MRPFEPGDKVWIDNIHSLDGHPEWIREKQEIESIWDVPLTDDNGNNPYTGYAINIVGIPYLFDENDLRKA